MANNTPNYNMPLPEGSDFYDIETVNEVTETTDQILGTLAANLLTLSGSLSALTEIVGGKVDQVTGKGLSTNDFSDALKEKLEGIATGATKILVDDALSTSSTNPVQNRIVTGAINGKLPLAGGTVTGTLILSNTTDASGIADNACALKIGAASGTHLEFDGNEIISKASATTVGSLYINGDGGDVYLANSMLHVKSAGGVDISGQLAITNGNIVLDNGKAYRATASNGDAKSLIHLNLSNNVIINGNTSGYTQISTNTRISGTLTTTGAITMPVSVSLKGEDANGNAKSLIYMTGGNNVRINGDESGTTQIATSTSVTGSLTASGDIKSTGRNLVANNCTAWDGGVAGGYINKAGTAVLVGPDADNLPRIVFVRAKSKTQYSILRALNTSGTYTLTLPNSTGTLAVSSSDIRLKENIKPSKVSALDLVDRINLYEFDWKADAREGSPHWKVGMIADELEELDKNLVFGGGMNEDGSMNVKGIDTLYLLGYMIKAIQELKHGGG